MEWHRRSPLQLVVQAAKPSQLNDKTGANVGGNIRNYEELIVTHTCSIKACIYSLSVLDSKRRVEAAARARRTRQEGGGGYEYMGGKTRPPMQYKRKNTRDFH